MTGKTTYSVENLEGDELACLMTVVKMHIESHKNLDETENTKKNLRLCEQTLIKIEKFTSNYKRQ